MVFMQTPPPSHRKPWLFIRNSLIAWTLAFSVLLGALLSPSRPLTLLWLLPVLALAYQVWKTYRSVHPSRLFALSGQTPAMLNLPYEKVEFTSRDGLLLGGWFIPCPGSPCVILVHGLGGSASAMIYHAGVLFKHGYSSLLFDLRAHGSSQGNTSTYGILEANDVLGAVDTLRTRSDVDPGRIGALGISLGAQAVLRAALREPLLRGVVLDGLGSTMLSDHGKPKPVWLWKLLYPYNWWLYWIGDWMSGVTPPENTRVALAQLKAAKLLITTGKGSERRFGQILLKLASEPKEILELPRAPHAGGYFYSPREYSEAITQFFDRELANPPAPGA